MTPLLADGRVPHTPMEYAQARTDQMYEDQDRPERVLDAFERCEARDRAKLCDWRVRKRCEWLSRIEIAIEGHGAWFAERAYRQFDWSDGKWTFILHKSGEPTIMAVPYHDGDTCYITERLEPIEHKIVGDDPNSVGQAAVEFIGQIKLPVQNVSMPMEKEIHDTVHGGADLLCRCKLRYGIAVRDFHRFSPLGPWLPRYRETQLLGYPMSQ